MAQAHSCTLIELLLRHVCHSVRTINYLPRHDDRPLQYSTPNLTTDLLAQVRGYKVLLKQKREELGDKANKLKIGLQKLDETSVQVCMVDLGTL